MSLPLTDLALPFYAIVISAAATPRKGDRLTLLTNIFIPFVDRYRE